MYQESLTVLFYLQKARINQKGFAPLRCRITYLKRRKEFSTGQFVNPKDWNAKKQLVMPSEPNHQVVNGELSLIFQEVNEKYLSLRIQHKEFDVDDIFNLYQNKNLKKEESVIAYFQKFLERQSKLIGKDLQKGTWRKYEYVCKLLEEFIKKKYNKYDYRLNKLDMQFLEDFEYFLKTEHNHSQITANKAVQRFRKSIKLAIGEGLLQKDPFMLYKPGKVKKEVIFLTPEELKKLENFEFEQSRLNLVRNLFVFCCYTGLAYNEMDNLRKHHIINGFDGNKWIQMKRRKTGGRVSVPLLPKALEVVGKYDLKDNRVLPKFSNQKINSYLKEIAGIVGIDKSLRHHMARKTFASTVLLYNDVPMEIVSELLGHSSLKITQGYYGKVVQKRVSDEIARISKKSKTY